MAWTVISPSVATATSTKHDVQRLSLSSVNQTRWLDANGCPQPTHSLSSELLIGTTLLARPYLPGVPPFDGPELTVGSLFQLRYLDVVAVSL